MPDLGSVEGFEHVSWVAEGQEVMCVVGKNRVLCRVQTSMGRTARVVNPLLRIDTWVRVDELLARKA